VLDRRQRRRRDAVNIGGRGRGDAGVGTPDPGSGAPGKNLATAAPCCSSYRERERCELRERRRGKREGRRGAEGRPGSLGRRRARSPAAGRAPARGRRRARWCFSTGVRGGGVDVLVNEGAMGGARGRRRGGGARAPAGFERRRSLTRDGLMGWMDWIWVWLMVGAGGMRGSRGGKWVRQRLEDP